MEAQAQYDKQWSSQITRRVGRGSGARDAMENVSTVGNTSALTTFIL